MIKNPFTVFPQGFSLSRVEMNSINWSAPNIWVFIAHLVEHCSANAEATGSNPVEALKIFLGLKFAIAFKLQVQLRWAHLHFMLYFKWSCLNSLTSLWFPLTRRIDSVFDTSTSTGNRFKSLPSRTSDKTPDNGFLGSLIFLGCCCSGVFLWTCLCLSCAWFDFFVNRSLRSCPFASVSKRSTES